MNTAALTGAAQVLRKPAVDVRKPRGRASRLFRPTTRFQARNPVLQPNEPTAETQRYNPERPDCLGNPPRQKSILSQGAVENPAEGWIGDSLLVSGSEVSFTAFRGLEAIFAGMLQNALS